MVDFAWERQAQRYRAADGRFVPARKIVEAIDNLENGMEERAGALTTRLGRQQITLQEWRRGMEQTLRQGHVAAAGLASGGFANLTPATHRVLQRELAAQLDYLDRFTHDLEVMDAEALAHFNTVARSQMYSGAARTTFSDVRRNEMDATGTTDEERNDLGGAVSEHCSECPRLTLRGWVPLKTLPMVGRRLCISRCHCTIRYRRSSALGAFMQTHPPIAGAAPTTKKPKRPTFKAPTKFNKTYEYDPVSNLPSARQVWNFTHGDLGVYTNTVYLLNSTEWEQWDWRRNNGMAVGPEPAKKQLRIEGVISDKAQAMKQVGRWARRITFDPTSDTPGTIEHEWFTLDDSYQGTGLATAWNAYAFDYYKRAGYKGVTVHADLTVGGYTWARQGFDFDDAYSPSQRSNMLFLVEDVLRTSTLPKDALAKLNGQLAKMQKRVGTKNPPTAYEMSQFGKEYAQDAVPQGGTKSVPLWAGKEAMLGSDWHGVMPFDPSEYEITEAEEPPLVTLSADSTIRRDAVDAWRIFVGHTAWVLSTLRVSGEPPLRQAFAPHGETGEGQYNQAVLDVEATLEQEAEYELWVDGAV